MRASLDLSEVRTQFAEAVGIGTPVGVSGGY